MLGRSSRRRAHVYDPREATRLELVALACEVAVLTGLMDEALERVIRRPGAQAIKDGCRVHRSAAMQLLSPETRFEEFSDESLWSALESFQARLRGVQHLLGRLGRMLPSTRGHPQTQWGL